MADKKLVSAARRHLDSIAKASAGEGMRMRLDYADRQGMTAALARKKIKTEGRSDAYVAKRYATVFDADFDEGAHPRDEHGRFGAGAAAKAQADLATKHAAAAGSFARKASVAPTAEKAEKHAAAAGEHARASRLASNAATAIANPSGDFNALKAGGKSILAAQKAEGHATAARVVAQGLRTQETQAKSAAPGPYQTGQSSTAAGHSAAANSASVAANAATAAGRPATALHARAAELHGIATAQNHGMQALYHSGKQAEHAAAAKSSPRPDQPVSMKAAVPSTPGEKLPARSPAEARAAVQAQVASGAGDRRSGRAAANAAGKASGEADRATRAVHEQLTYKQAASDGSHILAAEAHYKAADANRASKAPGAGAAVARHEMAAVEHTRSASPLDVTHEGKTYSRTGKYGRDMKTGAPSAEYKNTEAGDARVWRNLRTGETKPD